MDDEMTEPETAAEPGQRHHRRWPWVVLGVVVVLGVGAWWFLRDQTTPVELEDAIADFQAADAGTSPAGMPDAGVYAYTTTGSEQIDFLGGLTHDYPATTPMTVTPDACGVRLVWAPLQERREEWLLCPGPDGIELRESVAVHEFVGQADARTSTCDDGSLAVPADLTPGTTFGADCASEGTRLSGETTATWRGEVIGAEDLTVDGETVQTVHLRLELTNAGATSGSGTVDRWVLPDSGLPVKEQASFESRSGTIMGTVVRTETYGLELSRLAPYR